MKKEAANNKKEEVEVFPSNSCGRFQKGLWDLMEKPDTSVAAKVIITSESSKNLRMQLLA